MHNQKIYKIQLAYAKDKFRFSEMDFLLLHTWILLSTTFCPTRSIQQERKEHFLARLPGGEGSHLRRDYHLFHHAYTAATMSSTLPSHLRRDYHLFHHACTAATISSTRPSQRRGSSPPPLGWRVEEVFPQLACSPLPWDRLPCFQDIHSYKTYKQITDRRTLGTKLEINKGFIPSSGRFTVMKTYIS
jgi:hypothetical protein